MSKNQVFNSNLVKNNSSGKTTNYIYWRITNTVQATGSPTGLQWIIYELKFRNSEGGLISTGGTPFMSPIELYNPAPAFDGNEATFSVVTNKDEINFFNGIGYQFNTPIKPYDVILNNLNNGDNIPPTNYIIEKSNDGNTYTTHQAFSIGTNNGINYTVILD